MTYPRLAGRVFCSLTIAAAGLLSLAGCQSTSSSGFGLRKGGLKARMVLAELERRVSIENGPVVMGRLSAIDIANPGGSVRVIVDDRYPEATVQSRVRFEGRHRDAAQEEGWEFDFRGPWFTAEYDTSMQAGVLRVRPTTNTLADGTRPFVDVVIRTPVCDGLRILNQYGDVEALGVQGGVSIDSGANILVKTNKELTAPVTARSSGGAVTIVAPPGSQGTFLLTSPNGAASFSSAYGTVQQSRPQPGEWSGVWNSGPNAITLHSDTGNVSFIVDDQPEMFIP